MKSDKANKNVFSTVCWDLFCKTVEGRPYPSSCVLINGKPAFCAYPIPKGSKPNLKLLADMLRSETPIPPQIRNWLADMMDEGAKSDFQFKKLSKRKRGAKINNPSLDIAVFIRQRLLSGEKRKNAISDAMKEFKSSHGTVEAAFSSYKPGFDEIDRINLEEAVAADAKARTRSK